MGTRDLGQLGEDLACEYLVSKGFVIMGRNYRINFGEIDIIAKKNPAPLNKIFQILNFASEQNLFNRVKRIFKKTDKGIHFVEVKSLAGSGKDFFPEDRVDYYKKEKLKKLAEIWMESNKFPQNYPYQIDIVAILINGNKKDIKLFENILAEK